MSMGFGQTKNFLGRLVTASATNFRHDANGASSGTEILILGLVAGGGKGSIRFEWEVWVRG
jgi:hypothetical protein